MGAVLVGADGRPLKAVGSANASGARKVHASGYSNSAASLDKTVFKGWKWSGGSPDDDIVHNLPIIRQRSRQLTMDAPVIAGLYKTLTTNVVGDGLRPEPTPDAQYLGLSSDAVQRWKSSVLRAWETFAETANCDVCRRDNFYELTRLVERAQNESGDVFVTMPVYERKGAAFNLKLRVIEADCVENPDGAEWTQCREYGNDVYGGVETDENGEVVAYWFYTGHPLSHRSATVPNAARGPRWVRVKAYGDETGRVNVLHLMESLRPNQRRGLPIIAPVIELALTLDRYMKAEATAAQVQAMFTLIVTSENPDASAGEMAGLMGDEYEYDDDSLIALGNGIVQYARPGESVIPVNPTRPTTAFESFVTGNLQMMGPAVGVPYELLLQRFNSSYSASRAALNMANSGFKAKRAGLVHDFCQPVYEAFLDEAVARGFVYAPGYWSSPIARRAYARAKWNGPAMAQIDPLKEVQAINLRVASGYSTYSEGTRELTGGDWYDNVAERGREEVAAALAGISLPTASDMTEQVVVADAKDE